MQVHGPAASAVPSRPTPESGWAMPYLRVWRQTQRARPSKAFSPGEKTPPYMRLEIGQGFLAWIG